MGDVQGPEKLKNACVKTVHARMDRGFTVHLLLISYFEVYTLNLIRPIYLHAYFIQFAISILIIQHQN
jgi:hypothetical protein